MKPRDIDGLLAMAYDEIRLTYGHRVEFGRKSLQQFGLATDLPAGLNTEITSLNQNEIYLTDNLIDSISSSNAADTDNITIEGMQLVDGDFVFVTQQVVLQGQTRVALPTPLARATRGSYDSSSDDLTGDVYVYENTALTAGVPTDLTKAHLKIDAAENVSLKAGIALAANNYFILFDSWAYVTKKQVAVVDVKLRIRRLGEVFKTRYIGSLNSDVQLHFEHRETPYRIIRPNSDVIMLANPSVTGVSVSAGFDGVYADIT